MAILTNFPFEQVNVEVWAIEHVNSKGTNRSTALPWDASSGSDNLNNTLIGMADAPTSTEGASSKASTFEDSKFIEFMEQRGYYLFDMFCYDIPDYIFVKRSSDVFRRLEVPQRLWRRRGLCLHKSPWKNNMKFSLSRHRDSRHWPTLAYSPSKQ